MDFTPPSCRMSASGDPSYPKSGSELGKGDYICLGDKNRPCKIVELSISKTGKHGHAKSSITATDIFDGRKFEDSFPTTHNVTCPRIFTENHQMTSYDETHVQYMTESGDAGDIAIPDWPEGYGKSLIASFEQACKDGNNITITVQSSMGISQIMSHRVDKN